MESNNVINLDDDNEIPQVEEISVLKHHFEIQYALYFNYSTTTTHSQSKHPISHRLLPISTYHKNRARKGAWLSSSSSIASLCLFTNTFQSLVALVINLHGNNIEEHFVSNLHFSWSQISCVSQSPIRGSRVVFASYKDSVGQIQKFAMRFLSSSDSESFINALQESLNIHTIETPSNDFPPGICSKNEFTLGKVHKRAVAKLNTRKRAVNETLVQPSLVNGTNSAVSEETPCPDDFRSTQSDLPASFMAFLAECNTEPQEEPLKILVETDLMYYLAEYMSSSSFHDMLGILDRYINVVGGDSVLQFS